MVIRQGVQILPRVPPAVAFAERHGLQGRIVLIERHCDTLRALFRMVGVLPYLHHRNVHQRIPQLPNTVFCIDGGICVPASIRLLIGQCKKHSAGLIDGIRLGFLITDQQI
jgi:hypothetical protein